MPPPCEHVSFSLPPSLSRSLAFLAARRSHFTRQVLCPLTRQRRVNYEPRPAGARTTWTRAWPRCGQHVLKITKSILLCLTVICWCSCPDSEESISFARDGLCDIDLGAHPNRILAVNSIAEDSAMALAAASRETLFGY